MKKQLIILAEWKGETAFQTLKIDVESKLGKVADCRYIIWLNKAKELKELPKMKDVNLLTNKDFNLFGKLKNKTIQSLVKPNQNNALLIALEESKPFLKRILKNVNLPTIGIANEKLPNFDISIQNSTLKKGHFFEELEHYLTKIQF